MATRKNRRQPKPFNPTGLKPGAEVKWRELVEVDGEREWTERVGQVWSAGAWPKSAWVVPFERSAEELAVLVRDRGPKEAPDYRHDWTYTTKTGRALAPTR